MHVMLHKKSITFSIVLWLVISIVSGCTADTSQKGEEESPPLKIVSNEPTQIETDESVEPVSPLSDLELQILSMFTTTSIPDDLIDTFSYTYGYMLMDSAMRELPTLNPEFFLKGAFDVGVLKEELLTKEERNAALFQFQDKLISEAGVRVKELAEKNLKDAESFLAVNGQREGVVTTDSGLQYEVITPAQGLTPTEEDVVKVHYKLTYLDGREGDSSVPGVPSTFKISKLVDGFKEGLYLMKVGSSYRFYVHPKLGYGESGSTRIEPNTLLIFDVELVEIVKE